MKTQSNMPRLALGVTATKPQLQRITMNTVSLVCSLALVVATVKSHAQPFVTNQPTNQSVSLGASVTFRVAGTSTNPPIIYQWRFASTNLNGQTSSSLNLTNIQLINAGDYDAILMDNSGSVTSRLAHLEVDPAFRKITTGAIVSDGGYGFGCAWGDYDNDGFIDLFVCNFHDPSGTQQDFLYHNLGDGTFQRITNLPMVNASAWATGAAWGDYDNDGNLDLFVTRPGNNGNGPNTLYHNDGGGKFTKVTTGLLVTQSLTSHAGIWADFDNDGFLDLFVANFRYSDTVPAPDNYLYYNNGNGGFQRVSFGAKSIGTGDSFDAAAADFNNDGWIDLVVAQGATYSIKENTLPFTNNHNRTFTLLTNSVIFTNLANSAAVAWGDYDNDGLLDLFVSNNSANSDLNNFLYHNNGDGTFTLVTNSIFGLEKGSSTGCAWGDYDNDGWLDLFVAHVGRYDANFNVVTQQNNCLYHNNGDGTFTKISSGSPVNEAGYSFGCAWGDYDNDGFLDLFVSNGFVQQSANNFLYHNGGNSNNWINFRLIGTVSNRSAIGAKVRVKATIAGKPIWQMREISGGSGHGCQNDLRANFGLGDATNVDVVRIEWPSGSVQELHEVSPKQFLTVTEPPRLFATLTNGVPQFTLKGGRGFQYQIVGAVRLTGIWNWSDLGILTITNQNGTALITDTFLPATTKSRFYYAEQVSP
jgi:hypothetical protein